MSYIAIDPTIRSMFLAIDVFLSQIFKHAFVIHMYHKIQL